jgi:thiamine pyrophosphokinase
MTDGELAVNHALERGASQFVLAGGLGGQSDHALAHVGLALSLAKSGRSCLLTSGEEEGVPILPGQTSLELASGDRISIVPLSDIAGFDLEGVKWPLSQRQVDLGSSLTVSNVAKGSVQVRIRSGCGIAFLYPSGDR